MLKGAEKVAKEKGYQVLFCHSDNNYLEENRLIDRLTSDNVSGIIIYPIIHKSETRKLYKIVKEHIVPVVTIDRTFEDLPSDFVGCDNFKGSYEAVKHLVGLGHKKIVF